MSKRKISIGRLILAFVVGLLLAVGIKLLLHRVQPVKTPQPPSEAPAAQLPLGETEQLDMAATLGIETGQLVAFLETSEGQQGRQGYPLLATLQNAEGDYLADQAVRVKWDQGEEVCQIGSSGVLVIGLDKTKWQGLKLFVPKGYTYLRQQTIPLGKTYQPLQKPDVSNLKYDVVWDREIGDTLRRELYRIQLIEACPRGEQLRTQLQRRETTLQWENFPSEGLSPSEIYQRRKGSVVVVASLLPDGRITKGTGFVVDAAGVVATAFHVINKPQALAQIIMTSSGETFPVTEVLAAGRSADVALVRTAATNLAVAPLAAEGDLEGEAVTVISHPEERYFSLTQGYICRYSTSVLFGETVIRMTITAEFADGSSGAPVFNSRGEVTGLVSFTSGSGDQMVHRFATPVAELRRLVTGPGQAGQESSRRVE